MSAGTWRRWLLVASATVVGIGLALVTLALLLPPLAGLASTEG